MSIECLHYRPHSTGNLLGFATIFVTKWGLEISGCSLHQKNGARWVNLPSREYTDDSGEKKYAPILRFKEKAHYDAFVVAAKQAIEAYAKANAAQAAPQAKELKHDDIPF